MKNSEKLKKLIEKLPEINIECADTNIAFFSSSKSMHISIYGENSPSFKLKDFDEIRIYFEKVPHGIIKNPTGTKKEIAYRILKE